MSREFILKFVQLLCQNLINILLIYRIISTRYCASGLLLVAALSLSFLARHVSA